MSAWTIVLAAGEGTRLRPLTRRLHGDDRPKQFAVLRGERSMLQETLGRMKTVSPPARTLVVVGEHQADLAREQLGPHRGTQLILQPRNLGTAIGLLLPLTHLVTSDPDATVVITPADHHFARPDRFVGRLPYAELAAHGAPSGICLVAVAAEEPSSEYGWIVPGASMPSRSGANLVAGFVEKPDAFTARQLHEAGALWNTFVMVGRASAFLDAFRRALPIATELFKHYQHSLGSGWSRLVLRSVYRELEPADFCADVLSRTAGLGVIAIGGTGWSDWGTPERLRASLAGTRELDLLERRLRARAADERTQSAA
jgi:mannose-1-phosphate guanylyltransferase